MRRFAIAGFETRIFLPMSDEFLTVTRVDQFIDVAAGVGE